MPFRCSVKEARSTIDLLHAGLYSLIMGKYNLVLLDYLEIDQLVVLL